MDPIPTPSSAISRERGFSASHNPNHNTTHTTNSSSPRPGVERNGSRSGTPTRRTEENLPPATLPKAFEGMLKTTTETGDIGMFSIKPSRVPPPLNSPRRIPSYNDGLQKPQKTFQPYGVPSVDDRRRLPSYTRDPTSELISMYESPSQKPNRIFDDRDYRSYSMTQTTSYTLSNHRSYTSLRSQAEGSALLQRPRSPFAYPTRLKRPGFRPSSPALTDGGGVDYRRRAEIDRPYGAGHNTSSPSSLYAHKRKPPLALRPEGNRSTPSLLSQPSPPRRCSSPLAQHSGNTGGEWPRRNGPASINTSPARSTLSLSSTVNLFAINLPPSNTTTPGKPQQPVSPLYYDYTEDFDVEDYHQPREPPPQFLRAESIPEDRPVNSERPSLVNPSTRSITPSLSSGVRISSSSGSIHHVSMQEHPEVSETTSTPNGWPIRQTSLGNKDRRDQLSLKQASIQHDQNLMQTSRINRGSQELSNHADTAVDPTHPSSLGNKGLQDGITITNDREIQSISDGHKEKHDKISLEQSHSTVEGLMAVAAEQNEFPTPNTGGSNQGEYQLKEQEALQKSRDPVQASLSPPHAVKMNIDRSSKRSSSLDFSSALPKRMRSSDYSIDAGLSELTELISTLESANGSLNAADINMGHIPIVPPDRTLMNSPTIPDSLIAHRATSVHKVSPPLSSFNQNHSQSHNRRPQMNGSKNPPKRNQLHQRARHIEPVPIQVLKNLSDLSPQIPRKSVSRSGSPMLAPKPISPARQLKLKNSVPQLMKALPPLPPELNMFRMSPVDSEEEIELPCRFSLLKNDSDSSLAKDIQTPSKVESAPQSDTLVNYSANGGTSQSLDFGVKDTQASSSIITSPPKLRLKLRNSGGGIPPATSSSHDSRPWNSEENYPWSNQNPSIRLPSLFQGDKPGKSQKFKLKTTRSSNPAQDTVIINRDAAEPKPTPGSHTRNHKDLFTPVGGIDSLFRHVSKHIHSRKASTNSNHPGRESSPVSANTSQAGRVPHSGLPTNGVNSIEIQSSIIEESSITRGHHSLKRKLSNLRARLVIPYILRGGAQSCDDVTSADRVQLEDPKTYAARSAPNLHASIGLSVEVEDSTIVPTTERARRIRLKEKFSRWLKGARSAIAARVRSLGSSSEK